MNNYRTLVDAIIQDEVRGTPRHEAILVLGKTPEFLVKHAGFPELDLAIKGRIIGKAFFDHGITKPLLKKLPEIIAQPKCVFRSANSSQTDSVVVLTFELKGSAPIIVPIRQNQKTGRGHYFNLVTSVYGKEGPDPEEKWKKEGLLLCEP